MRSVSTRLESCKIVFVRGFAPDPAGGAYDASPDPLVGWRGDALLISRPFDAFGVSTQPF